MKNIYALLALGLALVLSSCAPGTFARSRGVPMNIGETWELEFLDARNSSQGSIDLKLNVPSTPAQGSGNRFRAGDYVLTFNPNATVENLEYLDTLINNRYYFIWAARINGQNVLAIDIDRDLSSSSSCLMTGWKYGDERMRGTFTGFVDSGQGSFVRVSAGSCQLSRIR